MAARLKAMGRPEYENIVNDNGHWYGSIVEVPERLREPLSWRKPQKIFVCSMSDLFHPGVSDEFIFGVFATMCVAKWHTFQILTKRPQRMLELISEYASYGYKWPLPNVWLGVSVENQQAANERIPLLLQTPAAVRFVSAEPLLGPVQMSPQWMYNDHGFGTLDWIICGGESGPGARPMHPDWARSLRGQCEAAGVPYFFKQWGEWRPVSQRPPEPYLWPAVPRLWCFDDGTQAIHCGKAKAGRLLDGREWNEFPKGE
jgi:protein gp37